MASHPAEWAKAQSNLAVAYGVRILGDREENFKRQIECYQQALLVYTREEFPGDYAITLFNLGLCYKASGEWISADQTFADAIETVESLREWVVAENYTPLETVLEREEASLEAILSGSSALLVKCLRQRAEVRGSIPFLQMYSRRQWRNRT